MEGFTDNEDVLAREWSLCPVTDVHHGVRCTGLLEMPEKMVKDFTLSRRIVYGIS